MLSPHRHAPACCTLVTYCAALRLSSPVRVTRLAARGAPSCAARLRCYLPSAAFTMAAAHASFAHGRTYRPADILSSAYISYFSTTAMPAFAFPHLPFTLYFLCMVRWRTRLPYLAHTRQPLRAFRTHRAWRTRFCGTHWHVHAFLVTAQHAVARWMRWAPTRTRWRLADLLRGGPLAAYRAPALIPFWHSLPLWTFRTARATPRYASIHHHLSWLPLMAACASLPPSYLDLLSV